MTAPSPNASSAQQATNSAVSSTARSAPGLVMLAPACVDARTAWPAKNEANDVTSATTSVTHVSVMALAA